MLLDSGLFGPLEASAEHGSCHRLFTREANIQRAPELLLLTSFAFACQIRLRWR